MLGLIGQSHRMECRDVTQSTSTCSTTGFTASNRHIVSLCLSMILYCTGIVLYCNCSCRHYGYCCIGMDQRLPNCLHEASAWSRTEQSSCRRNLQCTAVFIQAAAAAPRNSIHQAAASAFTRLAKPSCFLNLESWMTSCVASLEKSLTHSMKVLLSWDTRFRACHSPAMQRNTVL